MHATGSSSGRAAFGPVFAGCALAVETRLAATFDAGFDRPASAAGNVIVRVDPDGPAYAAGLRDGTRRIARAGGEEGSADVPLGYRIADADGERVVSYLPRGPSRFAVQQVVPTSDASSTRCRAVVSGALGAVP